MKKLFYLLICILSFSCTPGKPDQLFYKHAEVLDIKRDDEGQYHMLVKFSDGQVKSLADVKCLIYMKDIKPCADLPYCKWDNGNNSGIMEAWELNSTDYSYEYVNVYLPNDYKIELFND